MTATLPVVSNYVYSDSEDGTCEYSITKATLTLTADNKSKVYDGAVYSSGYSYQVTGLKGADTKDEAISEVAYIGEAITTKNVGSYAINIGEVTLGTKGNNYAISKVSGTLTINAREITLVWQTDKELEYNGSAQGINVVGINNEVSGEESAIISSLSYSGQGTNVGQHTMLVTLDDAYENNYDILDNECEYSIAKATLTLTADNKSKVYDGAVYSSGYSYQVTGLKGADTKDEAISEVTYIGEALTAKNVGSYAIDIGEVTLGAKGNNYAISKVSGTLTINKKGVTINFSNLSQTYDGNAKEVSAEASDSNVQFTLTYSYAQDNQEVVGAPINADTYMVEATIINEENYEFRDTDDHVAQFVITPKNINVEIDEINIVDKTAYVTMICEDGMEMVAFAIKDSNNSEELDSSLYNIVKMENEGKHYLEITFVNVGNYELISSISNANYQLLGDTSVIIDIEEE